MKKYIATVSLILVFTGSARAVPHPQGLGIGVVLGDPIGPTVKYWMSPTRAIDVAVGFQDDPIVYADYIWQAWTHDRKTWPDGLGGYLSLGPRYESVEHHDDKLGVRTMAGVNFFLPNFPIELFGELGPVFQVSPDLDTDIDAGVGVRIYFR